MRWPKRTVEERFFDHTTPEPNTGCLLWTGAIDRRTGYAIFGEVETQTVRAHRFAFFLKHGRYPRPGFEVCHSCDMRSCVEERHLFEGTRSDNMQDAARKGRVVIGNAKLTKEDAVRIRARLATGERAKDIAADLNVTPSVITRVKQGWTPKIGRTLKAV